MPGISLVHLTTNRNDKVPASPIVTYIPPRPRELCSSFFEVRHSVFLGLRVDGARQGAFRFCVTEVYSPYSLKT